MYFYQGLDSVGWVLELLLLLGAEKQYGVLRSIQTCPKVQCCEVSGSIQFGKMSSTFGMGHVNFLVTLLRAL